MAGRSAPPIRPKGLPKTGGRKKGTPNKATVEGREFARSIVDDAAYRERLRARMLSGEANPAIEQLVWHYAYGKPTESLDVNVKFSLAEKLRKALERANAQ